MRVLVTGANGMFGTDLCRLLEETGHEVVRTDLALRPRSETHAWTPLDICDTAAVKRCVAEQHPDAVVHAAAMTDVDGCERDPDRAFRINAFGTWSVASACGSADIPLVYVSTDFVFDGTKREPYTEFDRTNPISHYGASKLAGERYVAQLCRKHFITRTAWLFGVHGRSFPNTILELAKARTELPVVCDEVGSPTHTLDLARTVIALLESELYGTYHVSNAGHCSRNEMAKKTIELAGVRTMEITSISRSQYASPTQRPAYSVLRRYSLEMQGRDNLPPWQEALANFIALYREAHASR